MGETKARQELLEANEDFEERLRKSPVTIAYDAEHDMLLVTIGSPQEAITEQIDDRLYARIDPDSSKIVGFTITAFQKGFLREHADLRKGFETVFERPARLRDWQIRPRTRASRQASEMLERLVPA